MTKLRACDISEGVSRVEQDTPRAIVRARLVHTLVRVYAPQGGCTYPNGPRSDLIRSGSKKVLQLQSRIASLDDPAQGTGGEKCGFERRGPKCFVLFITADGHEFTSAAGPHSSQYKLIK